MLPKWRNPPWAADVAHMQVMHIFGGGHTLYMHPAHEKAALQGNRWPLVVYHDPIEPIIESNTDSINKVAPTLTMMFSGMIHHVTSSRILVDSGASLTAVSHAYCQRHGIHVEKEKHPETMMLGDGTPTPVVGCTSLNLYI
jgi:hypothetical protein